MAFPLLEEFDVLSMYAPRCNVLFLFFDLFPRSQPVHLIQWSLAHGPPTLGLPWNKP